MKIKMSYLEYILCIFPFLEMPRLGLIPAINYVFLGWKAIVAVSVITFTTMHRKWNIASILLVFYCLIEAISTIMHNGNLVMVISDSLAMIMPFLVIIYFAEKLDVKKIVLPIIVLYFLYALLTSIQLIQIPFFIFREHGLRDSYTSVLKDEYGSIFVLGDPKRFVFILLPLMYLLSIIRPYTKKKNYKVLEMLTFAIVLFDIIYSWGVSALFAIAMFVLLIYFYENRYLKKIADFLSIWKVYIIIVIANVAVLSSSILNMFGTILALFGKTTNLSGRTYIWLKAIPYINESPLWGQGYNLELIQSRFYGFVHLHNWVLNILYTGGILRLLVFIMLNIVIGVKLSSMYPCTIKRSTIVAIFCLLIIGLTDTPDYGMLFVFYAFGYCADKFHNKKVIQWAM